MHATDPAVGLRGDEIPPRAPLEHSFRANLPEERVSDTPRTQIPGELAGRACLGVRALLEHRGDLRIQLPNYSNLRRMPGSTSGHDIPRMPPVVDSPAPQPTAGAAAAADSRPADNRPASSGLPRLIMRSSAPSRRPARSTATNEIHWRQLTLTSRPRHSSRPTEDVRRSHRPNTVRAHPSPNRDHTGTYVLRRRAHTGTAARALTATGSRLRPLGYEPTRDSPGGIFACHNAPSVQVSGGRKRPFCSRGPTRISGLHPVVMPNLMPTPHIDQQFRSPVDEYFGATTTIDDNSCGTEYSGAPPTIFSTRCRHRKCRSTPNGRGCWFRRCAANPAARYRAPCSCRIVHHRQLPDARAQTRYRTGRARLIYLRLCVRVSSPNVHKPVVTRTDLEPGGAGGHSLLQAASVDSAARSAHPPPRRGCLRLYDETIASTASRIAAATVSGRDTLIAWDAPAISWIALAAARCAMKRWSATGMLRSASP